mmetsp:Transcript_6860/g.13301  ORF Transcript_6860/g.13301 Transcript_6860/m.13301 type:complete len:97 (-) Transcript_6860:224-514(-)
MEERRPASASRSASLIEKASSDHVVFLLLSGAGGCLLPNHDRFDGTLVLVAEAAKAYYDVQDVAATSYKSNRHKHRRFRHFQNAGLPVWPSCTELS